MDKIISPTLLITDYYDSLIREIDIYTEEQINRYDDQQQQSSIRRIGLKYNTDTRRTFGVETYKNPYRSDKYTNLDKIRYFTEKKPEETGGERDYLNMVRKKAIDEIRKVQEENLEYYRDNKERFKVDRENLDEEKIEELRSKLFANRFCFLVNVPDEVLIYSYKWCPDTDSRANRSISLFKLHIVITDFYLRESDIDYLRFD